MVFSSLPFLLLFLPVLLVLYFIRPGIRWRNWVLTIFSLLFYAWGEPKLVFVMLLSTLINFGCGIAIDRARGQVGRKLCLVAGVIASLGLLVYFKYAAFLVNTAAAIGGSSWRMESQRLPIGISFYTFQILTYTIDVYRGKVKVQKDFLSLLLYVSCFPQLIAGPIVQYGDVEEALSDRSSSLGDFCDGGRRFLLGLSKKVLLSNILSMALEECTLAGNGAALSVGGAWLAGLLYTLHLYFDFSAYSDMAIGLGRILGFSYKENFNYPYISRSPSEFWRRWHISLGSFFREYVYIPLGGNRKGRARTILNLFVVWALTGLWHGASWNFVVWGLYWFLLQQVDKAVPQALQEKIPSLIRGIATFLLAIIGWVLFYYTDLSAGLSHICAMFGSGGMWMDTATLAVIRKYALFYPVALICALPVVPAVKGFVAKNGRLSGAADTLSMVLAVGLGIASLLFLVGQSSNPFIYFRF